MDRDVFILQVIYAIFICEQIISALFIGTFGAVVETYFFRTKDDQVSDFGFKLCATQNG